MELNKEEMIIVFNWVIKKLEATDAESTYGICSLIRMYYRRMSATDYSSKILEFLEPKFKMLPDYKQFWYNSDCTYKKDKGGDFHFQTKEQRIEFLQKIIEDLKLL